MYGNAADILKEDSGIFELLADDDDNDDSHTPFNIRKQSISYAGLEAQSKYIILSKHFIFVQTLSYFEI